MGRLGHTDLVVVCDAGLPIPPSPPVADLAFRFGVPAFETVISGLLEALVIEGAIAAEEVEAQNPRSHELLETRLPGLAFVPTRSWSAWSLGGSLWFAPAKPPPTPTSSSAAGRLSKVRSQRRRAREKPPLRASASRRAKAHPPGRYLARLPSGSARPGSTPLEKVRSRLLARSRSSPAGCASEEDQAVPP
jgi:hypothetical protein